MDDVRVYTWDPVAGGVESEGVPREQALNGVGWQVINGLTVVRRTVSSQDGTGSFVLVYVVSVLRGLVLEWFVFE